MTDTMREIVLKGVPISRGIAIGKAFIFALSNDDAPEFNIAADDIDHEISRYQKAVENSKKDVLRLQAKLKEECIEEGAEILDAQIQIMQDPLLTVSVETEIRRTRKNAEFVFDSLIKKYQKRFQSIKDAFFRERFKDIQDISRRVAAYLKESIRVSLVDIPPGSVVIAEDLTASEAAEANSRDVCGFITQNGGATSHAAIVAKAKGIPYVSCQGIAEIELEENNINIIVDGRKGEIIINPTAETLSTYETIRNDVNHHLTKLQKVESLASETYDGYTIKLSANLEMVNEIDLIRANGSHGVGLFRSEYIFLASEEFPPEDIQFEIYKRVVEKLDNLPIVIRTFDVGGDKLLKNQPIPEKGNPFLGCRALRFLLNEREIFKSQLKAILRAGVYGDVSILFPMVSALNELIEAKALLEEAKEDLRMRSEEFVENVKVGCMIEVPSAAVISDLLASECDFLSIGTNDLVQYSLAVDRGNHNLQKYYSPTHPSVLRLIKMVVSEANIHGIPVSVCGEIASDPRFTPLLLGLGVHELSLATRFLPTIKNAVRNTSIVAATQLAEKVLTLSSAEEIMNLLTEEYQNNVPEDCFYNY
ncbi:MAG: phosphoenolpyruvate--protein phosphotransferase [Chlamydiota bacterium]|nr:phosphoenolpyruvate--protein phosphotransferase [Chlamydiota bacterium]